MRNKIGNICMVLGIVLLVGALSLLIFNKYEDWKAKQSAEAVLEKLLEASQEVSDNIPNPYDPEMLVKNIDGNDYIGVLSVPSLNLDLPVMSDWDYSKLTIAPCRYYGSSKTDDMVIAAHNYPSHFGSLKNLHVGDTVIFTDVEAVQTMYEVMDIEQLNPKDVLPMQESGYDLTLFTCTLGGKYRVTVRCDRVTN